MIIVGLQGASDLPRGPSHESRAAGCGQQELAADLLGYAPARRGRPRAGRGHGALAAAELPADVAHATLGDGLRGEHPGRTTGSERSVYAPVGLPWQDLAVAWAAYRQAERLGIGTRIGLLG
ncbi:hypothetical protein OH809_35490 [Streptomyces sp. NBC_00873]|uniref:hypothetical protein n=1 Tax=unclassified Streptomyces TaxID=2593676 RepID=UPI00386391BF|nr:hypothetical protein OH809_35490 [Streptomyces sp. NBC_00873]WTA42593.1 hypothetical protein OH821_08220 [Streptomyces sp. NBC_00842]